MHDVLLRFAIKNGLSPCKRCSVVYGDADDCGPFTCGNCLRGSKARDRANFTGGTL
jgi:hypothetical protein